MTKVLFVGPDPRSPGYDIEYLRSRLAHHGIDMTTVAVTDAGVELPSTDELREALNKMMVEIPRYDPEPTQHNFDSKEQVLERQRKERLTKHVGKKAARWR
jgi:ribosomal protein L16 Arg81 hydroxylase